MVIGMENEYKERERLPDILKGFAIIMVVFGHCIQEGSGELFKAQTMYFSDKLYQLVYSFHMPLFMMVSGYLSYKGMAMANTKHERLKLLKKRTKSLLLPIFLWTAIDYVRILVLNHINGTPQPEALVFVYFYNAFSNLWFLWAVFWCFVLVYIVHYFFKDSVILYSIVFFTMFFTPDGLGLGAYKYMMPFFVTAFYAHDLVERFVVKNRKIHLYALISGIVFVCLFIFYNEESFIYLTGYKLLGKNIIKQLGIDFYRALIGFAGAGFFVFLWQLILNKVNNDNVLFVMLQKLGRESMGIYIVSGYLLIFIINRMSFINEQSYLLNMIESVIVLVVSYFLVLLLKKIPILCKLVGK